MLEPEAVTMRPEIGSEQDEQETVGTEVPPLSHGRREVLVEGNFAGVVKECFGRGRAAGLGAG